MQSAKLHKGKQLDGFLKYLSAKHWVDLNSNQFDKLGTTSEIRFGSKFFSDILILKVYRNTQTKIVG